jgi:hypothetical protein
LRYPWIERILTYFVCLTIAAPGSVIYPHGYPMDSTLSAPDSDWLIEVVEDERESDGFLGIDVGPDDFPHIAYFIDLSTTLSHAERNATVWGKAVVDDSGLAASSEGFTIGPDGIPHMCYSKGAISARRLTHAYLTQTGWKTEMVDDTTQSGDYCSISIGSLNYVHIAYQDSDQGNLRYARFNGTSWSNELVDGSDKVGDWTSLKLDSSQRVAVAYVDRTNLVIRYAVLQDGRWRIESVGSLVSGLGWPSLDFGPSNIPHISYISSARLKHAWNDTGWSIEDVVPNEFPKMPKLRISTIGEPHFVYWVGNKYNYTTKHNGVWRSETIWETTKQGSTSGIALDSNDLPHSAFIDRETRIVYYATKANFTSDLPPIANSGGPYVGKEGAPVPFDGTGSSDPEGGILSFTWDFDSLVDSDGDGNFINDIDATGPTPTHTYYDDGLYVATLTVTDSQGLQDTDQCNITVLNVAPIPEWTSRSTDGTILAPPYPEGKEISFEATVSDPGVYDTFTYDWDLGDGTVHLDAGPKVTHTYGDDKTYTVVLTVTDDDGGVGVDDTPPLPTTNEDPVPKIDLPFCIFVEGLDPCDAIGSFTDPGWLDTHSAVWDFGDGTSETAVLTVEHQPPDSTGWNLSSHLYGDNGLYTITFTVTDDDGGKGTATAEVPVQNQAPSFDLYVPITVNEGEQFVLGVEATDPGSDDLTISVDWGDGTSDSRIYYNDGVGPDPPNSGAGVFPFMVQVDFTHVYPDDGDYDVTVEVEDDDGGSNVKAFQIPVLNVAPTVTLEVLPIEVDAFLRIAGEKWHDVSIELFEDGVLIANGTLVRYPGSPDEQMLDLSSLVFDHSKKYEATVTYTPDDDPVNGQPNGANPCWIILNFSYGQELWLHHTFNVNHPDTYVWEVDLTAAILSHGMTFEATAFDPGADELTLTWDFGDGANVTSFHPNPNGTYPVQIVEVINHVFPGSGTYVVVLTVEDDDGGVGIASVTITIP